MKEYRVCYNIVVDDYEYRVTINPCDGNSNDVKALLRDIELLVRYVSRLLDFEQCEHARKCIELTRRIRDRAEDIVRQLKAESVRA